MSITIVIIKSTSISPTSLLNKVYNSNRDLINGIFENNYDTDIPVINNINNLHPIHLEIPQLLYL